MRSPSSDEPTSSSPPIGQPDRQPAAEGVPALRVLIADDNQAAADILAMIVKRLGNDVRTAYDGQQAIDVAADYLPHVVLMDLGMPRLNGYDAARQMRDQPWGRDIVLVALTGWGQDEDRQRSHDAGFDHHLIKPTDPSALKQLFAQVQTAPAAPETHNQPSE